MTARVLTGTKHEIAQQVASLEGEVCEAIVFIQEPAATANQVAADEDMFAEMEPYMVDVGDFDDSRAAIYQRQEGEVILLDTNLLTRLTSTAHHHGVIARRAVDKLRFAGEQAFIVPQNLYEFWAVATRKPGPPPAGQNGLGMTVGRASLWLGYFQRRFTLLPDLGDLLTRWHDLVKAQNIIGIRSHDARLAAAMQCYGITRLLTFSGGDFQSLPVTIVDPQAV